MKYKKIASCKDNSIHTILGTLEDARNKSNKKNYTILRYYDKFVTDCPIEDRDSINDVVNISYNKYGYSNDDTEEYKLKYYGNNCYSWYSTDYIDYVLVNNKVYIIGMSHKSNHNGMVYSLRLLNKLWKKISNKSVEERNEIYLYICEIVKKFIIDYNEKHSEDNLYYSFAPVNNNSSYIDSENILKYDSDKLKESVYNLGDIEYLSIDVIIDRELKYRSEPFELLDKLITEFVEEYSELIDKYTLKNIPLPDSFNITTFYKFVNKELLDGEDTFLLQDDEEYYDESIIDTIKNSELVRMVDIKPYLGINKKKLPSNIESFVTKFRNVLSDGKLNDTKRVIAMWNSHENIVVVYFEDGKEYFVFQS